MSGLGPGPGRFSRHRRSFFLYFPSLVGLRVAEHVAAGCEGEWPEWNSFGPVLPRDFRSHRDWCPRFAGTSFDPNAEANSYGFI